MGYRSLKVIETGAILKLGCNFLFTFYSITMAVSVAVCEINTVRYPKSPNSIILLF